MKIAIIGYSGSGKSTLAKSLEQIYDIPVLHLDSIRFLPNWKERKESEFRVDVLNFMQQESWIIDGNFSEGYYQEPLDQADCIIMVLFPAYKAYWRVIKRYIKYRGKTRPDMSVGCLENLNWAFTKWIWCDGRLPRYKANYQRIAEMYANKVVVLTSQKEINRYVKNERKQSHAIR